MRVSLGLAFAAAAFVVACEGWGKDMGIVDLPKPKTKGAMSVEEAIAKRRSVRSFSTRAVPLEAVSQLLWSCQGMTDRAKGLRAAPSAGALYPLEIYLAGADGLFYYNNLKHGLRKISDGDVRESLSKASLGQSWVRGAPISIIICAEYGRVTRRYGERGIRYVDMEAGHAAENVALEAVALGLDSVPVGAFDDDEVARILGLPDGTRPLYIPPIGYKK